MANINHEPRKQQLNLLHVLPAYSDKEKGILNTIIEINKGSMYKYELITESGQLKLDRVNYSSMSHPATYGAIPETWDLDNDPLDILIVGVTEPLAPGCLVEARILGIMKMEDGGEMDDKVIAVLSDDKRVEHIKSLKDLGDYFIKETQYFWEHYKDLKKPGTVKVLGFFDATEAKKIIDECVDRYQKNYLPKVK